MIVIEYGFWILLITMIFFGWILSKQYTCYTISATNWNKNNTDHFKLGPTWGKQKINRVQLTLTAGNYAGRFPLPWQQNNDQNNQEWPLLTTGAFSLLARPLSASEVRTSVGHVFWRTPPYTRLLKSVSYSSDAKRQQ